MVSKLISLLCACLACFTLASMPGLDSTPFVNYLLFRFATLTPFVLWFIAFFLFTDNNKIHLSVWIAISYFVLVRGAGMGIAQADPSILDSTVNFTLIQLIPELMMLFFSWHTLYLTWVGYKADLIEKRRQLRLAFVLSMGLLLIIILSASLFSLFPRFSSSEFLSGFISILVTVVPAYIFLVTLVFNIVNLKLRDSALSLIPYSKGVSNTLSAGSHTSNGNEEFLTKIEKLMKEDKLFMQTGLTIASLAAAMSTQEYRLRRFINKELGYKNFNQFLNNYRIEAASKMIKNSNAPISNVALDVGYASLSVFNKAFKDRFKLTPTEYRTFNQQ